MASLQDTSDFQNLPIFWLVFFEKFEPSGFAFLCSASRFFRETPRHRARVARALR